MRWLRRMSDGRWRMGRRGAAHPGDPALTVEQLEEQSYDIALSWEYEATPPFAVRIYPAFDATRAWGGIPTLELATQWFTQEALPLRGGWMASITDFLGIMIVGYNTRPTDVIGGDWVGVAEGFAHLERASNVHPVDCAFWETRAKRALG